MSGIFNPTPASGGSDLLEVVSFTYATPSPMLLQAVLAGQIIDRAVVVITTPFDDPSSSVYLGITASTGLILGAGDVTTDVADQYENAALFEFAANDFLELTITPATSTQGAGFLFYRIKE